MVCPWYSHMVCTSQRLQALLDKMAVQRGTKIGEDANESSTSPHPVAGFRRLAAFNRPEWMYGVGGLVCAAIAGLQVGCGMVGLGKRVLVYLAVCPKAMPQTYWPDHASCSPRHPSTDAHLFSGPGWCGERTVEAKPCRCQVGA